MALVVYWLTCLCIRNWTECWWRIARMLLMSGLVAKFVWTDRLTSLASACRLEYFGPWLVSRRCGQRCGCRRWEASYGRAVGSSARQPRSWACGSEFVALLGSLIVSRRWRLSSFSLYTVCAVLVGIIRQTVEYLWACLLDDQRRYRPMRCWASVTIKWCEENYHWTGSSIIVLHGALL